MTYYFEKISTTSFPIASFMFDDVITLPLYDRNRKTWIRSCLPNWAIIPDIYNLYERQYFIYIFVERIESPLNNDHVRDFMATWKVPFHKLIWIGTSNKIDQIVDAKVNMHYDNDRQTLLSLPPHISGILVHNPEEWFSGREHNIIKSYPTKHYFGMVDLI